MSEKLIKSKERKNKFGEVYTPVWMVQKMCDMLGDENPDVWSDITKTFLEPACGNGNFLVEILSRKLSVCKNHIDGLKALNSIYGIDIQLDNVIESRQRMFDLYAEKFEECHDVAEMIIENHIICGDSLKIMKRWSEENAD